MRKGDLLLVGGSDPLAMLIRRVTGSPWNHVAVAVSADALVEATSAGVVLTPLAAYRGRADVTVRVADTGLSAAGRAVVVAAAMRHIGARYGWWEAAAVAASLLSGGRLTPTRDMADTFTCSELAALALQTAGVILPKTPAAITPGDLAKMFLS